MIRSEVLKDHSDHSVENGLEMGRVKCEECSSEPSSVDLGRDAGGFDQGEGMEHEEKGTHLRENREDEQTELDKGLNKEAIRRVRISLLINHFCLSPKQLKTPRIHSTPRRWLLSRHIQFTAERSHSLMRPQ